MFSDTLTVLSFEFPTLLVALLAARYLRVGMLNYAGIVIILATVKAGMAYASGNQETAMWVGVVALVSLVLSVILAGAMGSRMSVDNHKSLLGAMSLFPWYLGLPYSVVYIMLSMGFLAAVTTIAARRAFASVGHRVMKPERARKEMTEGYYNKVMTKARVIFAMPIAVSAFVTIGALSM